MIQRIHNKSIRRIGVLSKSMATLRYVAATLQFVLFVSSVSGDKVESLADKKPEIVEFEKEYPNELVLATFENITTCHLDDEFKTRCKDKDGKHFTSSNSTACVELGCCYWGYTKDENYPHCYMRRAVVGRNRNNDGGYYVIGNRPQLGPGYGYPPNTIPGPVTKPEEHTTAKPTISVLKPTVKVYRFRWRDYTFSFFKMGRTYGEAMQECQKESTPSIPSSLLEVSNGQMSDYITGIIRSWEKEVPMASGCQECMGYWIGGNDKSGRWRWESGNNLNLPSQGGHQNWYRSGSYQEPNRRNAKSCLTIAASDRISTYQGTVGRWFDADCNTRRHFICMRGSTVKSTVFSTGSLICAPGSCLNGGECFPFSTNGGFQCRCNNGYTGDRCQIAPRATVPPTQVVTTSSCCAVNSYRTTPCGPRGIPSNLCRFQLGCCYNEVTKSCYHRALGCTGPTRTTTTLRPTTPPTTKTSMAYWLKWSGWSQCSRSCGQGRWTRIRGCMGGLPGQGGCIGEATQTTDCNEGPCVVAVWTSWNQWSACPVSCGAGRVSRVRVCQSGGKPAASCPGLGRQEKSCSKPCPAWSDWGGFGECSVTCGSGFYSRKRSCVGGDGCPGDSEQTRSCTLQPCPVGVWSEWSVFQACTASCGAGTLTRARVCRGGVQGGSGCPGLARVTVDCNTQICIGWGQWGQYGACTRPCGGGTRRRSRTCNGGRPGQPGCAGEATMFEDCNTGACDSWSSWTNVGTCTATCDSGRVTRTRTCFGGNCVGAKSGTVPCNTLPCSYWSGWTEYGDCSVTCGSGERLRTRECQGGFPGDRGCQGLFRQTVPCTAPNPFCVVIQWGQWTQTGECSKECGGGKIKRVRACIGGTAGQAGCQGSANDEISCNLTPCGRWEPWGMWSACSLPALSGRRYRTRVCTGGNPGSPGCPGSRIGTEECDEIKWSQWSEWSDCSETCGSGTMSRFRRCLKSSGEVAIGQCDGQPLMTMSCRTGVPCDGWSTWAESRCSVTCGVGLILKRRTCIGGIAGQGNCIGAEQDTMQCRAAVPECITISWGPWENWASCSVTCGKGIIRRTRRCNFGNIGDPGCSPASGAEMMQECTAAVKVCSYHGEWSPYGQCSQTCGGGRQTRTRTCIGGTQCVGASSESVMCNNQECSTWGEWESWSQCSQECGTGVAKRVRRCIGGEVGGPGCMGRSSEESSCNTLSCPTWSSWSDYTQCDRTCGTGATTRTRTCLNGQIGQTGCEGRSLDSKDCNTTPCESWSEWDSWTTCSAPCGGGVTTRTRTCLFGVPGVGACRGNTQQLETCNEEACSEWGPWVESKCSVTCGVGVVESRRECVGGIAGVSEGCLGSAEMVEQCNAGDCEYWGPWQLWSECSVSCGGGATRRMRECVNGKSGDFGCSGPEEQTQACGTQMCPMWDNWGEWSSCTVTCGGGKLLRRRSCMGGEPGSGDCLGVIEEDIACGEKACPKWSEWLQWSECSSSCDGGTQVRERQCDGGKAGTEGCIGKVAETATCNSQPCPRWSEWGTWTECTITCGGGTRIRGRTCNRGDEESDECIGSSLQTEQCNSILCPTWSRWGAWSICNATCGEGSQVRVRTCPGGTDGEDCEGESMEIQTCTVMKCPEWTVWGNWSVCSATCGTGVASRSRKCEPEISGLECVGSATEEKQCSEKLCPSWSGWGVWSECSSTCGDGQNMRFRTCIGGDAGADCIGDPVDSRLCNEQLCPEWTSWGDWSDCSSSCGEGSVLRFRICEHGLAGSQCPGESIENKDCNTRDCPIWGEWSPWSLCSTTCGEGESTRQRVCIDGEPGIDCLGESIERDVCSNGSCADWDSWSEWSSCSATCGGGDRSRTRECTGGTTGEAGCRGEREEIEMCGGASAEDCPTWSEWSIWSGCNTPCGGGVQSRTRICINGHLGEGCGEGDYVQEVECNTAACASWSLWSPWMDCSKTCGWGETQRTRTCVNGIVGERGCELDNGVGEIEQNECLERTCPEWSPWSEWSDCSATCGDGFRDRTRICSNGMVGDAGCEIDDGIGEYEEGNCALTTCAAWGEWSAWGSCSTSCGGGTTERYRECENGLPGEPGCEVVDNLGNNSFSECNEQLCPQFSDWGEWSACNASCSEQGIRVHSRVCLNGEIGQLGCEGPVTEDQSCSGPECAYWSEWFEYGECSRTCGGGVQTRLRLCINGEAGSPGCGGQSFQERTCNEESCSAEWSLWETWTSCSRTCGEATRSRFRICANGEIGSQGCEDESMETESCAKIECPTCTPVLDAVSNGNVSCSDGANVGSTCTFICDDGFRLFGESSALCESDGDRQWSNDPPNCIGACNEVADIVFIIDSSSSIREANFDIIRNFLKSITSKFTIGSDATQFGAIRYNREVSPLWNLNEHSTYSQLANAIDNIPYDGSGTLTGSAIRYADENMFTTDAGRRPNVPKIAVVITDGVSFDDVSAPASRIKGGGALVVAVGVGRAKVEQINEIASEPDSDFSTVVENFADLSGAVSTIANQIKLCEKIEAPVGCPPQVLADILLIVDSSSSIGNENFDIVRGFIKDVIGEFNLGPQAARFGLITYNRNVNEYFTLRDHEEADDIFIAIDRMPYSGSGTRTGSALQYASRNSLTESSGARAGVPKVVVVITDGKSQDNVSAAAAALKEKAEVIVIGIKGALRTELVEIATAESDVFTTDFDQLSGSLEGLKLAICAAAQS